MTHDEAVAVVDKTIMRLKEVAAHVSTNMFAPMKAEIDELEEARNILANGEGV